MEHTQLLEQAFTNYLEDLTTGNPAVSVWPAGLVVYPGENNLDKNGQRIVCYIEGGQLGDEEPINSGNRNFDIICELRTPWRKLSDKDIASNVTDPFITHQAAASALQDGIVASLPDLLMTAQAGLTIIGLKNRTQIRLQEDQAWVSGWKITGLSCPCTFPN